MLPSECSSYQILNDATRNHKSGSGGNCDSPGYSGEWNGEGWYRMMHPAGTKITEQPPPRNHCGTQATGWLNGSHPSQPGESVSREVCFNYHNGKCQWKINITVTNCIGHFVYHLPKTPNCAYRYCADYNSKVNSLQTQIVSVTFFKHQSYYSRMYVVDT